MGYTPDNNPYIPGDPYSYDLKWMVSEIKRALSMYDSLSNSFADLQENFDTLQGNFNTLSSDFTSLYNYVHDYFDNLDLSQEVSDKIDEMAADGTLLQLIADVLNYVTPEMYGAKGDGVTDDTAALQAAIASGAAVILGPKTYLISDTLQPVVLMGSVTRSSKLVMSDEDKPIIDIFGTARHLAGFTVEYAAYNSNDNKKAIFVSGLLGQSIIENMYINNCAYGIYADVPVYSCNIKNIWVNYFSKTAVYLNGIGSTGCVLSNIYITNWEDYAAQLHKIAEYGVLLRGYTECSLDQINVEHGNYISAIYLNSCDTIKIGTVHLEGFVNRGNYVGFITCNYSNALIDTINIVFSGSSSVGYSNQPTAATLSNLFALLGTSSIDAQNVFVRDTTWTYATTAKSIVYSDGNVNQRFSLTHYHPGTDPLNSITGVNNGRIPVVERINDEVFYRFLRNNRIEIFIANTFDPNSPSLHGNSLVGDRFPIYNPNSTTIGYITTKKGDFDQTLLDTTAKLVQYNGVIYLSAPAGIQSGDRLEVNGNVYTTTSGPYGSSTYPGYPYAVNITPNAITSDEGLAVNMALPELTAITI